jgi:hypothetical protein
VAKTESEMRGIRVNAELWAEYAGVVGNHGRAADLRAYIEWRVDNPRTPLPGRRRGPVVRNKSTSANA